MKKIISLAEAINITPRGDALVKLNNPTNLAASVEIFISPPEPSSESGPAIPSLWCQFTVAPGADVEVPKSWVNAIITIRDGWVQGGHAPQLRRAGQTEDLHWSLKSSVEQILGVA